MRCILVAALVAYSTVAVAQSAPDNPDLTLSPARSNTLDPQVSLGGGTTLGVGTLGLEEGVLPDPDRQPPTHRVEEPKPAGGFILTIPLN